MKKSLFSVLLLLLLSISVLLPTALSASELSFSAVGERYAALSPAEVLAAILKGSGQSASENERAYLTQRADLTLTYSEPSHALLSLEESDGGLRVSAAVYRYEAENGTRVVWTPARVEMGEASAVPTALSDDEYTATLPAAAGERVRVTYTVTLTLPSALCEQIANRAYSDGLREKGVRETWAAYEVEKDTYDAYLEDRRAYDAYLEELAIYEARLAEYEAYLTAYAIYEDARDAYEDYLDEKEAYEADYLAYLATLREASENEEAYGRYLAYIAELEACRKSLSVMEYITRAEYRFLPTLNGSTVSTVLERRNELISLGCSQQDLDTAAASTEALRTLYGGYVDCEGEEARYLYYRENYTALRDHTVALYEALFSLFTDNAVVRQALEINGKMARYMQFMGQLYIAAAALDDSLALDEDWEIRSALAANDFTRRLEEALMGIAPIPQDDNAANPTARPYPTAVDYAIPSDIPSPPTPPLTILRPNAPAEVEEPSAPEELDEPTEVEEPTAPTAAPTEDPLLAALADAVTAGRLTRRNGISATTLTLSATVEKLRPSAAAVVVYDDDRRTVLAYFAENDSEMATYTPPRKKSAQHNYDFLAFVDGAGNPVSLADPAAVAQNPVIYATYTESPRTYTVTWQLGSQTLTEEYAYGEMPACPFSYRYEVTYRTAPTAVTADATYVATRWVDRSFPIHFRLPDGKDITVYGTYGNLPSAATLPAYFYDGAMLSKRTGITPSLAPITGEATYTLSYTPLYPVERLPNGTYLLRADGDEVALPHFLALGIDKSSDLRIEWANKYAVLLPARVLRTLDATAVTHLTVREESAGAAGVLCRLTLSFTDGAGQQILLPDGLRLYLSYDGGEVGARGADILFDGTAPLATSYGDGWLFAPLAKNGTYQLEEFFTLQLESEGNGGIEFPALRFAAGERVSYTVSPAVGYYLESLTLTDADGNPLTLDGDGFTMPRSDLRVRAVFARRTYTVRFLVDGVPIAVQTYYYGDTLTLPANPQKTGEDGAVYQFNGWSPTVVSRVTRDTDYHADFTEARKDLIGLFYGGFSPAVIFLLVLCILLPVGAVALILYLRYRKKKAVTETEGAAQDTEASEENDTDKTE